MGSSLSWKSESNTRGTFLLNLNLETLDTTCSALNLQSATVSWTDDVAGFPVYTVATSTVTVITTTDITSGTSNSVNSFSSTVERICEFFGNALDYAPSEAF